MEVYFKELISEETSLEKIVDDLERVVQGADDFAKSLGVDLSQYPRTDVARRLQELKENCRRITDQIISQIEATDRAVRQNPYSFIGGAVVLGMVIGARFGTRRSRP